MDKKVAYRRTHGLARFLSALADGAAVHSVDADGRPVLVRLETTCVVVTIDGEEHYLNGFTGRDAAA